MLGFGKKENSPEGDKKDSSVSSGYETPVHLMQDDLDSSQDTPFPEKGTGHQMPTSPVSNSSFGLPRPKYRAENNNIYSPFLNSEKYNTSSFLSESFNKKPAGTDSLSKKQSNWGKVLIIGAVVMTFAVLATGAYYFWITRNSSSETKIEDSSGPEISSEPDSTPDEPSVIIEPQHQKFSADNPNYLLIEAEYPDAETIKKLLVQTSLELRDLGYDKPVEFILTDKMNNPLTFQKFSVICGINLSSVAENLRDNFSLYLYPGSEGSRVALSVGLEHRQPAIDAMRQKEISLVSDISFLFLNETPSYDSQQSFNSNDKGRFTIRYKNLDYNKSGSLSIDYVFTNDYLIIATSKDAMSALMRKYAAESPLP